MEFDFNALTNLVLIAKLKEQDDRIMPVLEPFLKRGLSVLEALQILIEVASALQKYTEGEGQ